ncbi:MAG: helix-turn-helix domain-containing protein [Candidatus Omnitrophota bacterium]
MTRLMDIDDLANYLKLKKQTIYNWLHQEKISGIKVGGVWRFDRRDVDLWLQSRRRLSKEDSLGETQ